MNRFAVLLVPLVLAACAGRVTPPPVVATLPPPEAVRPPLPEGATPGMPVPARLADGSFPTPNRGLTPAATLWHLRAGLNVAALACRGAQEAVLVAGYNAWLKQRAAGLKSAETTLSAEYRAGGGDWRDRYDDAMTRLYNYWSLTPARDGLCAASLQVLAEQPGVGADALPGAAPGWLARLERPITDFYAAYDAWRSGAVMASAAAAPATPATPRLPVDPAVFD